MTRIVRQINCSPEKPEQGRPRPFSEFANYPNVVLLGDPGAGKSHLLREAAAAEGARLIKARAFLVTPLGQLCKQSLYIDGLDERRAGRGDRDTVDAIVQKLFAVNPARVRISCRAADWLGETDLAALRPFFDQRGDAPVLLLQKLSDDEQIAVLGGEGVDSTVAARFLSEAVARGLCDFLENPQNLLMFWRAVRTGSWPTTRRELFELATQLMLQEFDQDRARTGTSSYSVGELRPAAGAICAARLISDVDAISLTEQEGTNEIPGYRSLTLVDQQKVQAALGRRIFVTGPERETVDYAHRTTAEFLAASFLAVQVRAGLPLGRVLALIGVDGNPAPELRGLHAWLAVHLPEHAAQLVDADPYGVLTYGDAASLQPSLCAHLIKSLDRLSKRNPWFRAGNWEASPIAALARPEMVEEFRKVLNDPDAGFGIRSVIVDALALGTPVHDMLPDLATIVTRLESPYAERSRALSALFRMGDEGKIAILAAHGKLGKSTNELRLSAQIIHSYYGKAFGPDDIIALVTETLNVSGAALSGMLYPLADRIPDTDVSALLDDFRAPEPSQIKPDSGSWEVGSFYSRILVRAWRTPGSFDAGRALRWLRKRAAFADIGIDRRARSLRDALAAEPHRLNAVADHFLSTLAADGNTWWEFQKFRESIFFQLDAQQLRAIVMRHLDSEADGTAKQALLYELAFSLCYGEDLDAEDVFQNLYRRAESNIALKETRERALKYDLPANYFRGRTGRTQNADNARERQRHEFAEQIELIRAAKHLGWIAHLSKIYFGIYRDCDRTLTPHQRLSAWLGDENLQAALHGLRATSMREDLPSFVDVMALTASRRHHDWWYGLVAGLNEGWLAGAGFGGLSDDQIKALVAFDLTNPIRLPIDGLDQGVIHPWMEGLLEKNPELVLHVYCAVARLRLDRREQFVEGLTELLADGPLEPFRDDVALEFLRDFPNADPLRLDELLNAVMVTPGAHAKFLNLAGATLSGPIPLDQRQRDMWLVTAYLLSPLPYENAIEQRAGVHPLLIFDLRDRSGFAFRGTPTKSPSLRVLEFMARLTGKSFANASRPTDVTHGDTNAWDATEHFRALVGMISAVPSEAAAAALERLEADPALASYRAEILYARANQQQRRREGDYERPGWLKTIDALSNGPPATVADLYALLSEHLSDLKRRIERANTDIWKRFWNLDSWAKPIEPRPEEACRDDLVEMMRPSLQPLGIIVEPEGHMALDKRADISVAIPGRKILCELKRDYHGKVWAAIQEQLERFYVHDPEANGFGVYCVFWFGDNRKRSMPNQPNGLPQPASAAEMDKMLSDLMPNNMRSRINVVVIDVSGEH